MTNSTQDCKAHSANCHQINEGVAAQRSRTHNRNLAIAYAKCIPVFPCGQNKRPLTEHGHHEATTNLEQIESWWDRWPDALVGIPTGPGSKLWIVDLDGELGRRSFDDFLATTGLASIDAARCVSRTPGGGLHLIYRLQPGERPRNRAGDIGIGIDTRGVRKDGEAAGYFIAPGSSRSDGKCYHLVSADDINTLVEGGPEDAQPAPRLLLFVATFNANERQRIVDHPFLAKAIRQAPTTEWWAIFEAHERQRVALHSRVPLADAGAPAMRRQALSDLQAQTSALASLTDNRRQAIFSAAARLAKYVTHGVLAADEVRVALLEAWDASGATRKHGRSYAEGAIRRALELGRNDPLPPLARCFGD
jgi:hypothetical protein